MKGVANVIRFHRTPFDPGDMFRKVPLGSSILRLAILIVDYLPSLKDLRSLDVPSQRILLQLLRARSGVDFDAVTAERFVGAVSALSRQGSP